MGPLDTIRRQIESGEHQTARRALVALLRANPHHVEAWMLLASVLEDPQQQADCYRQVLSLDPGHRLAAQALAQLTTPAKETALRCPQCGGPMEVYFAGELRDKRARCLYCGTDVDLPDSFQRVQRTHTAEQGTGFQRFEDRLVVESRSDTGTSALSAEDFIRLMQAQGGGPLDEQDLSELLHYDHTFTKEDIERLLSEHGVSIPGEKLDDLLRRYIFSEREEGGAGQHVVVRRVESRRNLGQAFSSEGTEAPGCLAAFLRLFGESRISFERARPAPPAETSVETVIKAAGGPLPLEERRACPHCGATISRRASRCRWCGAWLEEEKT